MSNRFEQKSTQPNTGQGSLYAANSLEGVSIYLGKVDNTFPVSGCCRVSLYGLQTDIPCFMLSTAMGGMFGARQIAIPPMGTEVLVHIPQDRKFGYILGYVPSVNQSPVSVPAHQLITEGGVNSYSEKEPFFQQDWVNGKKLPAAGAGSPVDALPGDEGVINDLGCFVGVLRAMAALRGSDLAKVEAFVFDDMLNVVGHNLNIYTAQGETKVFDDYGRISEEQQLALTQGESLGADGSSSPFEDNTGASLRTTPDQILLKDKVGHQTLKPRWKKWTGWLGDFCQSFLSRPASGAGSLDTADKPDMGLYQEALTVSGQHIERSIVGGGIHKSLQIAVPKKKKEHDDPEGDKEITTDIPKKDFKFDSEHPMAISAQSRDYFAHLFNKQLPSNRLALTKDWEMPDEADCPAPGGYPDVPGTGDFFRDFPLEADVMEEESGIGDDTKLGSKKFRVGEAFMGIMPDGSILIRDAWGTEISTAGGHLKISASKDVTQISGGSSVILAGDDLIQKARKSIDITASEQQVRIKGERDILIHSEKGGILVSAPNHSLVETEETGEKQSLSGIVLKSTPGVMVVSDSITLAASQRLTIKGVDGKLPLFVVDCNSQIQRMTGYLIYKMNDEYVLMGNGRVITTNGFITDASIVARESIVFGGSSGKSNDLKKNPTIKSTLSNAVQDENFALITYTEEQLSELKFTYRSTVEYATNEGMWYSSQWQDTMPGLASWAETEIEKTYPWPGEKHYDDGGETLLTYEEVNVEKSGKPKKRTVMSDQHGNFKKQNFSTFKVHPDR